MRSSLRLALAAYALACLAAVASPSLASGPSVRAELYNGMARITLEGSYAGAHYTVRRAQTRERPFQVLGEQNALCTGDCTILDPDALIGATYLYRFDVTGLSASGPRTSMRISRTGSARTSGSTTTRKTRCRSSRLS